MEFDNQKDLFKYIRDTKSHICWYCKRLVYEPLTHCFPHLLPKGAYPEYKFNPNNIGIVCSQDCHRKLDGLINGNKYIIKEMLEKNVIITPKHIFNF